MNGSVDVARILVENGADVNKVDKIRKSSLMVRFTGKQRFMTNRKYILGVLVWKEGAIRRTAQVLFFANAVLVYSRSFHFLLSTKKLVLISFPIFFQDGLANVGNGDICYVAWQF